MQERKIDDNKIWTAYRRVMEEESLTSIAKELNINRGTLRKYIEAVVLPNLDEENLERYKNRISNNFKGNHEKKQRIRKKHDAVSNLSQSEQIKMLVDWEITPDQIEELYNLLRKNKHTAYVRDTFIFKCVEHLSFFESIGISPQEAFDLFIDKPKAFTSDTKKLKERYEHLLAETGSESKAREILLRNPRGRNTSVSKTEQDNNGASEGVGRGED